DELVVSTSALRDRRPVNDQPDIPWLLDAIPLFFSLTEDEKETIAGSMTRRTYKKDAILIEKGDTVASLMIVRSGDLV
ncbi:cyclic nucleotide-binding domain-containing protein, partial [Rhizobium johnstonii]